MCQVSKQNTDTTHIGGVYSKENFLYEYGILNLQYGDGEKCHHTHKHRITEITFVCDSKAGQGVPEFINETIHCFYKFIWKTRNACLPKVCHASLSIIVI